VRAPHPFFLEGSSNFPLLPPHSPAPTDPPSSFQKKSLTIFDSARPPLVFVPLRTKFCGSSGFFGESGGCTLFPGSAFFRVRLSRKAAPYAPISFHTKDNRGGRGTTPLSGHLDFPGDPVDNVPSYPIRSYDPFSEASCPPLSTIPGSFSLDSPLHSSHPVRDLAATADIAVLNFYGEGFPALIVAFGALSI